MTADTTIFDLRFGLIEKLQPSIDGLKIFPDSPAKEDKEKLHGDDLASYCALLKDVESFEQGQQEGFRESMLFTVIDHSRRNYLFDLLWKGSS